MTSYDALLSGSLRLPSKYTGDLIGSLRLSSIRANASFDWDADEMEYIISDITLPSFTFTMSGHLFRFEHEKEEKTENEAGRPDVGDMFILSDPLLYDMYVLDRATSGGYHLHTASPNASGTTSRSTRAERNGGVRTRSSVPIHRLDWTWKGSWAGGSRSRSP